MRESKDAAKPGKDVQESPGGHAMERLHQLQHERGLPETEPDTTEEPGGTRPPDSE
jgi:hypothetical protein